MATTGNTPKTDPITEALSLLADRRRQITIRCGRAETALSAAGVFLYRAQDNIGHVLRGVLAEAASPQTPQNFPQRDEWFRWRTQTTFQSEHANVRPLARYIAEVRALVLKSGSGASATAGAIARLVPLAPDDYFSGAERERVRKVRNGCDELNRLGTDFAKLGDNLNYMGGAGARAEDLLEAVAEARAGGMGSELEIEELLNKLDASKKDLETTKKDLRAAGRQPGIEQGSDAAEAGLVQ